MSGATVEGETLDTFQRGRFRLVQSARGHRSGTDALLLASVVPPDASGRLLDLGAGAGAVAFAALSKAPGLAADLMDADAAACDRAERGVALNPHLAGRARVVRLAVEAPSAAREMAGVRADSYDWVVSNPPFNDGSHRVSRDAARAGAHALGPDGLADWLRMVRAATRPGGRAALILRPTQLVEAVEGLRGFAVCVVPVHPRADQSGRGEAAHRVIVGGRKGARAALRVMPGVALHDGEGFTPQAAALLDGEATLDL